MKKILLTAIIAFFTMVVNAQSNWTFDNALAYVFSPEKSILLNDKNSTDVYELKARAQGINYLFNLKYHFTGEPALPRSKKSSNGRRTSSAKRSRSNDGDEKPYDFSAGMPIMLGYGFGRTTTGQSSFLISTGLHADINLGACKANSSENAGAFFGVGFGITNTSQISGTLNRRSDLIQDSKYTTVVINSYFPKGLGFGPNIHGGGKIMVSETSELGIYASYQPAVNKNGFTYYTIGLQLPFFTGSSGYYY